MAFENPKPERLRALLKEVRRVAVVGCSPQPYRMSNQITSAMQRRGFHIVPVHPAGGTILGMTAFADLSHVPNDYGIDMVNVFRKPDATKCLVREAKRLNARAIWLQHGIESPECAEEAAQLGLVCVMNCCWAVTYTLLM